ncbi:MAG TPA: EAL domain-containing protein [Devosia sp.]|nr:EAL domain-containing protein [Devosia sp.]
MARLAAGRSRFWPALALWAAIGVAAWAGWFAPLDNALREARFHLTTRGTSGSAVFVDIDAQSLATVGVWPWPRHLYAQMLDKLMQLGAADVVFDVDFSAASSETEDAAFERSLADAGGYAFLAAFQQQREAGGSQPFNLPLARFLKNAAPVAVNVSLDGGGVVRDTPLAVSIGGRPIASAAATLAQVKGAPGQSVGIDFSIDPGSIVRVSAADLLAGKVDPALLANRQVVIGASAVELRDFFVVPRYGIVPGAVLQILAAETLKQGRGLVSLGPWPALMALLLIAGAGLAGRRRVPVAVTIGAATALAVAIEIAASLLQVEWALLLDSAAIDAGLGVLALQALVGELKRRGELKRVAEERLRYLAEHDPLTGALSRTSVVEYIAAELAARHELAVVAIDLRRFRAINDTLGHSRGDELLKQVVQRLSTMGPDVVARLGADSFVVVAPATTPDRLLGYCEAITEWLAFPYELDADHQATIAASAGATLSVVSGHDPEMLLSHADMALSAAKQRTGHGAALFATEMAGRLKASRALDAALRQAVVKQEFTLLYQPQADLGSGRIVGAEALARWTHPTLGTIPPVTFIAAAEETGLIVDIGRWVLETACREAAGWPDEVRIAVNVSPVQFELSDVAADVAAALEHSGLAPERLDIEITEGVFVRNAVTVTHKLDAVRALGVGIALDDFGTGYSSLGYLGQLPIDKLKIDQSFVRRLPGDAEAVAIIKAVMALSTALGKSVVAEGIETMEQAAILRGFGCSVMQGYQFGRPMPATAIRARFDTRLLAFGRAG